MAATTTITAANSVLTLTVPGIFSAPQNIKGYAVDDAFMTEAVEFVEVQMGVDGRMSTGFKPTETKFTVTLMADSPSLAVFNRYAQTIKAAREAYPNATANVTLPGNGLKYALTRGVLTSYILLPDVKKVLQPVKYVMTFQDVTVTNT